MVGYEFLNFCFMGEDYLGVSGGNMRCVRGMIVGGVMIGVLKKWMNLILVLGWF